MPEYYFVPNCKRLILNYTFCSQLNSGDKTLMRRKINPPGPAEQINPDVANYKMIGRIKLLVQSAVIRQSSETKRSKWRYQKFIFHEGYPLGVDPVYY